MLRNHAIEKHRQLILDTERYIWKNPETGYREWKTHAYLKAKYEELGYTAFAPYSGTVYDLIKEEFEYVAQPRIIEKKFVPSTKAQRIFAQLVAAAERLLKTAKRMEGRSNKLLQDYTKRIESIIYEMEN